MSDSKLTAVKFLKQWRAYTKGDIAGFEEAVAKKLVDGGVADYCSTGKAGRQQSAKASAPKEPQKAAPADTSAAAADGASGANGAADGENYRP